MIPTNLTLPEGKSFGNLLFRLMTSRSLSVSELAETAALYQQYLLMRDTAQPTTPAQTLEEEIKQFKDRINLWITGNATKNNLPSEAEYQILMQILILENPAIVNKPKAQQQFRSAYMEALSDPGRENKFGSLILEHLESSSIKTPTVLAYKMHNRLREDPIKRLSHDDLADIISNEPNALSAENARLIAAGLIAKGIVDEPTAIKLLRSCLAEEDAVESVGHISRVFKEKIPARIGFIDQKLDQLNKQLQNLFTGITEREFTLGVTNRTTSASTATYMGMDNRTPSSSMMLQVVEYLQTTQKWDAEKMELFRCLIKDKQDFTNELNSIKSITP